MKDKKPTLNQTTWVITNIIENSLSVTGFFRELIYGRMGYEMDSYIQLDTAGLMIILNALTEYYKNHPDERALMLKRSEGWPFEQKTEEF